MKQIIFLLCIFVSGSCERSPSSTWEVSQEGFFTTRYENLTMKELVEGFDKMGAKLSGDFELPPIRLDMDYVTEIHRHDSVGNKGDDQIEERVKILGGGMLEDLKSIPEGSWSHRQLMSGDLTDVHILDALKVIAENQGFYVIKKEKMIVVSPRPEGPHVNVISVPARFRDPVQEILQDNLDPDISTLWNPSVHEDEKGYVEVLDSNRLLVIGLPSFYQKVMEKHKILSGENYRQGMWDFGSIELEWRGGSNFSKSGWREEFIRKVDDIEWAESWSDYLVEKESFGPDGIPVIVALSIMPDLTQPFFPTVVAKVQYDSLWLTQSGADVFTVTYKRKIQAGKYFSNSETFTIPEVELSKGQIKNLFHLHVEGKRDEVLREVQALGAEK